VSKTVLIFDLDTPIYKAAVKAEDRSILVTNMKNKKTKEFVNRTEFKKYLKDNNKIADIGNYTVTDVQDPHPPSFAAQILKTSVKSIIDTVKPDEVEFIVSGGGNFRDDLPLPSRYKWNRQGVIRPVNLQATRNFSERHFKALKTINEEPDDVQVWRGYEVLQEGNKPIVLGYDKDSLQYSGLFVYNPDKKDLGIRQLPKLGDISIDQKGKVRAQGLLQYAFQMLYGDRVDGLKPCEITGIKFGEISAYNILQGLNTEKEILSAVINQYKLWYPSDVRYRTWNDVEVECTWKEIISLYHKGLRMKETRSDPLEVAEFFDRFGLEIK
jgi:hypothetical protein